MLGRNCVHQWWLLTMWSIRLLTWFRQQNNISDIKASGTDFMSLVFQCVLHCTYPSFMSVTCHMITVYHNDRETENTIYAGKIAASIEICPHWHNILLILKPAAKPNMWSRISSKFTLPVVNPTWGIHCYASELILYLQVVAPMKCSVQKNGNLYTYTLMWCSNDTVRQQPSVRYGTGFVKPIMSLSSLFCNVRHYIGMLLCAACGWPH